MKTARLAGNGMPHERIVLCGKYSSTSRKVLRGIAEGAGARSGRSCPGVGMAFFQEVLRSDRLYYKTRISLQFLCSFIVSDYNVKPSFSFCVKMELFICILLSERCNFASNKSKMIIY